MNPFTRIVLETVIVISLLFGMVDGVVGLVRLDIQGMTLGLSLSTFGLVVLLYIRPASEGTK